MHKVAWLILAAALVACADSGRAGPVAFEYPCAILDVHDADHSCWTGMGTSGSYPMPIVLERWLVGAPPSAESAVTLPVDHWIDLAFSGRLADGDGNDITLVETGKAGEQALLFVTDGSDQEYLLTRVAVANLAIQGLSHIGVDLAGLSLPFVPRAVRLVALDLGGQSPGFDLGTVQARVSRDCGPEAACPNPVCGAKDIHPNVKLTWLPSCSAEQQVLYLGAVESEVRQETPVVRYSQPPDANSFEPPALRLGETYYWRIDGLAAMEGSAVRRGAVWSFTIADELVVDDFETYDVWERFLYESWQIRGRADASLEQSVFHSCHQSMIFQYRYDATYVSEMVRVFEEPQDWTQSGVEVLQLMLSGTPGNTTTGDMYIAIGDGDTEQAVLHRGDPGILTDPRWRPWRVALADFNGVNLANVTSVVIGLRPATTDPMERGTGVIYVDDIMLHPALCLEAGRSAADLNADCLVDCRDVERMATDWLADRSRARSVVAPNEPILWYEFDGNADDRTGKAPGQIQGRCNFVHGVYGQAVHFMNGGDAVVIPDASDVFSRVRDAVTITFWQRGDDSSHLNDTICCSNYVYGQSNPAIAIHLGCWQNPGQYRWDCGSPWSFENRLAGRHQDKSEWTGRWNHWAFTKDTRIGPDGEKGRMEIYLNGRLYDSLAGADNPITDITSFEIGSGWYGHYDGLIDDFQLFDYALSPAEIAWVATDGTGLFPEPAYSPADLNTDGTIDLLDFAALAAEWLESGLWP